MSELLPDAAVEAIQESARIEKVDIADGVHYFTKPLFLPPPEPTTAPVVIRTLGGFVDFVDSAKEVSAFELIHIASPTQVNLLGPVQGRHRNREIFARAEYLQQKSFPFNEWLPVENFIISLQANFESTGIRATILSIVGNLTDENVVAVADSGFNQTVSIRQGISLEGRAQLPNPVELQLFRTFAEIKQPDSLFVLRVKSNDKGLPLVGLWEAADGRWALKAIEGIKEFLEDHLSADLPILA